MKAKKTKLTAVTLSAFMALGGSALANARNEGTQTGGDKHSSNTGAGKRIKKGHKRHHKGGKKSKKNSGGTTTPPPK